MPKDISLNGIEFTIKGSSDSASKSVQNLVKNLNQLKEALKQAEGITGLKKALDKLANVNTTKLSDVQFILNNISLIDFSNLAEAAQDIRSIADAARSFANIKDETRDTQRQTEALQERYYNLFEPQRYTRS